MKRFTCRSLSSFLAAPTENKVYRLAASEIMRADQSSFSMKTLARA